MTILSNLKSGGRVAIVAMTLGAASLAAMPAQAAGPSLNFQLGIDTGGGVSGYSYGNKKYKPIKICLTDRQVKRGLERYGFNDANVVKKLGKQNVAVVARWGKSYYVMTVNKCSGEVSGIKKLRQGYDYFPGKPGYGKPGYGKPYGGFGYQKDGFSFQFNF